MRGGIASALAALTLGLSAACSTTPKATPEFEAEVLPLGLASAISFAYSDLRSMHQDTSCFRFHYEVSEQSITVHFVVPHEWANSGGWVSLQRQSGLSDCGADLSYEFDGSGAFIRKRGYR